VNADAPFRVLHALRIKGFAPTGTVAEIAGVPHDVAAAELDALRDRELARFREARSLWQLTPSGRDHHAGFLPGATDAQVDALREAYEPFLTLNVALKELCTEWQLRGGDGCVDRLLAHDADAQPVLRSMAAAVERLDLYRARLTAAADRVAAGDHDLFTGVLQGSYHDIWMELHEDLVCVLGIDRAAEGSF